MKQQVPLVNAEMCSATVVPDSNIIFSQYKGKLAFEKEMFVLLLMKQSFITHHYQWLMIV